MAPGPQEVWVGLGATAAQVSEAKEGYCERGASVRGCPHCGIVKKHKHRSSDAIAKSWERAGTATGLPRAQEESPRQLLRLVSEMLPAAVRYSELSVAVLLQACASQDPLISNLAGSHLGEMPTMLGTAIFGGVCVLLCRFCSGTTRDLDQASRWCRLYSVCGARLEESLRSRRSALPACM
mmetsp:Transcript_22951/g.58862  ORF Transcript_22951/g.58862 Transcript_22951/m.58862 type:complete len:181 (-) Transcript_22951:30-572(-)